MTSMVFPNIPTDQKTEIVVGTIEVQFTYPDGSPVAGVGYELAIASGASRRGTLDGQGKLKESNIPPGAKMTVRLTGVPLLALAQG
jgi:hypothetical protein